MDPGSSNLLTNWSSFAKHASKGVNIEPTKILNIQSTSNNRNYEPLIKIGGNILTAALAYYLATYIYDYYNNDGKSTPSMKKLLAKKLNRPEIEHMDFNSYELQMSSNIIACGDIETSFKDIGGMEEQLEDIRNNIVFPMSIWNKLKSNKIMPCPTGVLLIGAPGTGKTLTAKALAKETNATFLNISSSAIMDKWLGETDKRVSAVFTLARKLAPCIIFLDEIDTLLGKRESSGESRGVQSMQGVFLSEWDGLTVGDHPPVIVLGATNRPQDLDKAFQRRMSVSIQVNAPDLNGRVDILKKLLYGVQTDFNLDLLVDIATNTKGYTGSDLRELVRLASNYRIQEFIKQESNKNNSNSSNINISNISNSNNNNNNNNEEEDDSTCVQLRNISYQDFQSALLKSKPTSEKADEFKANQMFQEWNKRQDEATELIKKLAGSKEIVEKLLKKQEISKKELNKNDAVNFD